MMRPITTPGGLEPAKDSEAKQDLFNVAVHQLQEPLASMKWGLENILAGRSGSLRPRQQMAVQEVFKTNEAAIIMVRNFLLIARLEGGRLKLKPEPTDVIGLVRKLMQRHEPIIREHHGAMYFSQSQDTVPQVMIDPTLFSQVVDNLLSNAIKYNPTRTRVTITISHDAGTVTVAVHNEGPAIPKDKQAHLFEKFYRVGGVGAAKASGTGLGLYITKQIVELHGGELAVTSGKSEGTTFSIRLPLPDDNKAAKVKA